LTSYHAAWAYRISADGSESAIRLDPNRTITRIERVEFEQTAMTRDNFANGIYGAAGFRNVRARDWRTARARDRTLDSGFARGRLCEERPAD
jgi:hypothetical protein